ncbi:MAG: sulfotransferase, partial [Erythrobacter sp.]
MAASRAPVRDHPLARSPQVDAANRFFAKAWDKGWLPPPLLEADTLWQSAAKPLGNGAAAAEKAGRSKEDVADFRERLTRLTNAVQEEADLTPLGRVMAHGQIERVIRNRLRMGAVWLERPDMPETPIVAPIIIIGHMRSGTTRIHKLLAADPAHSHTRYCDAFHPVPARPDL